MCRAGAEPVTIPRHFFTKKQKTMKRKTDYTILACLIPIAIAFATSLPGCYSDGKTGIQAPAKIVHYVEYFKDGQVLYPDYACRDTLIVRDAAQLNKAMALVEQGEWDATEDQIDSIFHAHCIVK